MIPILVEGGGGHDFFNSKRKGYIVEGERCVSSAKIQVF